MHPNQFSLYRRLAKAFLTVQLLLSFGCAKAQEANYDEAKVGAYTLPDPLVMADGRKVATPDDWAARRREILNLFETHVYGRTPKTPVRISFAETSRDEKAVGGLATRKEVTVYLTGKKDGPKMSVLFFVPNNRTQPAPVFLGLNFNGNQAVSDDPGITLATSWLREAGNTGAVKNRATEKSRGTEKSRWPIEMAVKRGYAVATIYNGDLFPDHKDGLKESVIPNFYRSGQTAPDADEWNAMGAWAWGLSRAVDYIEQDKDLDAKRIAVIGHSRLGKAALWAGAQDERFAMVVSNDSGEGGAALARRNFGETVEVINTSFPHWFCGNFKKYNKNVASLPTDQHMLLALIAPRPLYVASAQEDQWADPRGEFLSAKAADPVYRLLGTDGLGAKEMPGVHQPVTTTIGHHLRAGKHDITDYDWEQYLNFADKHLRRQH
ncbi:MAG TPA: acetylxylan esterase [Blastocatellia bacterium]|nr:acetylxylan esterase [Blastocatellia bacterium]HMV86359.1 acetylxylan esterase [Blastocatellia bacterium]HMY73822.1 acetylxylan esterase [Blastocatellia bacterium]HMZ22676.1 acetylxylan esterase [Blastocatellia bacterium]HNG31586.1 acetylxylan esterase [Blastocatellia bacterium]